MILKNIRLVVALLCLTLLTSVAAAQNSDQDDALVLRVYYSDLYLALSQHEIDDVPFQQKQVKVRRNDSLLKLAQRNRIEKLDPLHFAAALYEANSQMFANGDLSHLGAGATIKMPSVGDIFYAQNRYENLKVMGDHLDLTNENNQMRLGLRRPFGDSLSMIGPLAGNEPLRYQDFTLPSRRQTLIGDKTSGSGGFQSRASREPVLAAASAQKKQRKDPGAAKQSSAQDNASGVPIIKLAKAGAGAEPAIAATAGKGEDPGRGDYLGPPRNSTATSSGDFPTDPLSSVVEWNFDSGASVGAVLSTLAEYVGYELISTDADVLDTYTRQLPKLQRSISGVTAEEGFLMLAGRGLETDFNHVTRSINHTPRRSVQSKTVTKGRSSKVHEKFVQASGISSMLRQLPADILSAAEQHASRCDSSVSVRQPNAAQLYKRVIDRLQQKSPELVTANLVDWYESPAGQQVIKLEKQQIDENKFERFSMDESRTDLIQQIYDNTVTGRGIAAIAVELDYAGWSLSGCKQKAESSGDVRKVNREIVHGLGIKKKREKLELILREDMLRTLAYQFSSLSERELTEYADIVKEHAGVYSDLQQSIVDSMNLESK